MRMGKHEGNSHNACSEIAQETSECMGAWQFLHEDASVWLQFTTSMVHLVSVEQLWQFSYDFSVMAHALVHRIGPQLQC